MIESQLTQMSTKLLNLAFAVATCLCLNPSAAVEPTPAVPSVLNHQGRIAVENVNFEGAGQFRFALVDAAATRTYWSNDGTSVAGSAPHAAVTLPVSKGHYSVSLGDESLANMLPVPHQVFENGEIHLRIWFDDGVNGPQLLLPDRLVAPAGQAMVAATVSDGAVTKDKLAIGAVTADKLAPDAITSEAVGSAIASDPDATLRALERIPSANLPLGRVESGAALGGCVTFISDDGGAGEYAIYREMFAARGVPCCAALIAGTGVGRISTGAARTAEYLELQNSYGWEILNHSSTHKHLDREDEASLEFEINGAMQKLRSLGFDVRHMVYPYGLNNETVRRITAQKHGCAFSTAVGINRPPVHTYQLHRVPLGAYAGSNNSLQYYKSWVDIAKATNGWLVFMLHPNQSGDDAVQQGYLADVLDYCIAEGVPILTATQALARFANVFESGDFSRDSIGRFAIGANGVVPRAFENARMVERGARSAASDAERDFVRFGVRPPGSNVNFTVGRVLVSGSGTGAVWGPVSWNVDGCRAGLQGLQRGTSAGNWVRVCGPLFDTRNNTRLWARFGGAVPNATFNSAVGRRVFLGIGAVPAAGMNAATNIAGVLADDSRGANILLISKNPAGETVLDTGLPINEGNLMGVVWTIDLGAEQLRVWRNSTLLGEIATNLPAKGGSSPFLQFDGPQEGSGGALISLREMEWGFNCEPWE